MRTSGQLAVTARSALMMRPLAFAGIIFSLLFMVCISLIQAHPYQPGDLEVALIGGDSCRPPCWQNIRPGFTTAADAVTLLADHTWVGQITRQDQRIEWTWSGQQPAYINASTPGWLMLSNRVVSAVNIPISVSMGDFYFLLGSPYWTSTHRGYGTAEVRLTYPGRFLALSVITRCPTTRSKFWRTRPDITLLSQRPIGIVFDSAILQRSIAC